MAGVSAAVAAAIALTAVLVNGPDGERENRFLPDPSFSGAPSPAEGLTQNPSQAPGAGPGSSAAPEHHAGPRPAQAHKGRGLPTSIPPAFAPGAEREPAAPPGVSAPPVPSAKGGQAPQDSGEGGLSPVLRPGDKGPEVRRLECLLGVEWPDGVYDDEVERLVQKFQRREGIVDDPEGVYGPSTRKVLEAATQLLKDIGS